TLGTTIETVRLDLFQPDSFLLLTMPFTVNRRTAFRSPSKPIYTPYSASDVLGTAAGFKALGRNHNYHIAVLESVFIDLSYSLLKRLISRDNYLCSGYFGIIVPIAASFLNH